MIVSCHKLFWGRNINKGKGMAENIRGGVISDYSSVFETSTCLRIPSVVNYLVMAELESQALIGVVVVVVFVVIVLVVAVVIVEVVAAAAVAGVL